MTDPLDDNQFDAALEKLQLDYEGENERNNRKYFYHNREPKVKKISFEEHESNKKAISKKFKKAKDRLYEVRAEARVAKRDGTKPPCEYTIGDSNGNLQNEKFSQLIDVDGDENSANETSCTDRCCKVPPIMIRLLIAICFGLVIGNLLAFIIKQSMKN